MVKVTGIWDREIVLPTAKEQTNLDIMHQRSTKFRKAKIFKAEGLSQAVYGDWNLVQSACTPPAILAGAAAGDATSE